MFVAFPELGKSTKEPDKTRISEALTTTASKSTRESEAATPTTSKSTI